MVFTPESTSASETAEEARMTDEHFRESFPTCLSDKSKSRFLAAQLWLASESEWRSFEP